MEFLGNKTIIWILGIVIALLLVFVFIFNVSNQSPQNRENEENLVKSQESAGIPLHVSIPKINVEADIKPAGLDKDGNVAVPEGPRGVTWYNGGARPGEKGSAVITGHYGPWLSGASSVFDNLNRLEKGDKVYIKNDEGKTLTFEVREKKTYDLNEIVPEVFVKDDASYLNIITCSGQWLRGQQTFTNRLVVFTTLVED